MTNGAMLANFSQYYPRGGGSINTLFLYICLNIYVFKGCTNYSPFYSIWIFDLATQLPTVQLHGFDISDSQYPSRNYGLQMLRWAF